MVNYENDETEVPEVDETEVEQEDVEVEETEEEPEEEQIDWKARALKAEETIIKAKTKPKATPKAESKGSDVKLSTFDLLALQKANIETEEDLEEVTRWAGYNGITVAEALKSTILKATLAEKSQLRTSAMAVNTGTGRRASGQVSDERLLADAEKGIMPESEADIAKLARLKFLKK